ncbi:Sodium channel protein type 10 subunit alpha (NaNG) (Sodium channel protein type X subunit alpha) (Voltage-gated sodium channel subunit alpha Nav1.8), partial [Durusdinium trenchii]
ENESIQMESEEDAVSARRVEKLGEFIVRKSLMPMQPLERGSGSSAGTRASRMRNSHLRFADVVPERPEEAKAAKAKGASPRTSQRSSISSVSSDARQALRHGAGRRTMFFDKSPEEMEAMFQEALNQEAEQEEVIVPGEDPARSRRTCRAQLQMIIETDIFEMFISLLILGNVVVMAAAVQYRGLDIGFSIAYPGRNQPASDGWPGAESVLNFFDVAFTLVFFAEMVLRLFVYDISFFKLALNWLDFTVVVFSFIELLAASIPGSSTVLRLVRLAKLARGLRVVRMARIMDSLNLLLKNIGASVSMLLWSMLLLAVIQCTAGMFVGYLVMDFLEKEGTPDDVRRQIYRYYGTFTYTILTMFEVIFANWPIPCRLLVDYVDEWFSLYFIIYRCVVGFCVLNVIGAVFVQQTMKVAADDHELFMQQQTRNAEAYARKIKDVF